MSAGRNEAEARIHLLMTGPQFSSTMQIPVLLGRALDDRDRPCPLALAVVSEVYDKTYFPDQNPLGSTSPFRVAAFERSGCRNG